MKKMTAKEFKQILIDVGYWCDPEYERVLNSLSLLERKQAEEMEQMGLFHGAEACRRRASEIYDALYDRGYYDDVKYKVEEEQA